MFVCAAVIVRPCMRLVTVHSFKKETHFQSKSRKIRKRVKITKGKANNVHRIVHQDAKSRRQHPCIFLKRIDTFISFDFFRSIPHAHRNWFEKLYTLLIRGVNKSYVVTNTCTPNCALYTHGCVIHSQNHTHLNVHSAHEQHTAIHTHRLTETRTHSIRRINAICRLSVLV